MDRTAWIAITLCVVGLILWEVYSFKQAQRLRPITSPESVATFTPTPAPSGSPMPTATSAPVPSPTAAAQPSPAVPAFAEVTETLRNSDVELHLTNRGGGIARAVLLNHLAEQEKHITLNSPDHPPIGAIVSDPAAPAFSEYKIVREGDALVFESTTPEQVRSEERRVG